MNVSSLTQTQYTQPTNKTTATNATLAYESTTTPAQTQQTNQKAEIQKKEEPTKATTEVQNETQEPIITTQQEIEIKQQVAQTISETEESPLATAIQESSQTQSAKESQATGRIAEMEEKYKDVYTPIPETYSKTDEDIQAQKIKEAYPNYVSMAEVWKMADKIYTEEFGEKKFQLGDKLTPEQEEKKKLSLKMAYEMFGGVDAIIAADKGVYEIKKAYPVNTWGKDERNQNATELARFHNAVVYEELENGKTIDEARKHAGYLTSTSLYMNSGFKEDSFIDVLVKAGRADPNAKQADPDSFKPDFNSPINTVWDLRQYGIEGDWTRNNIYNNDTAMIAELEKKIGQFNFMLNNENLIQQANRKLDPSDQNLGQANHYKEYINNEYLPETKFALDIFKNYKIYDSIDVKE